MADDNAVMFSIGSIEGWITKADEMILELKPGGISNAPAMLQALNLIQAAYLERIRTIAAFHSMIQELRSRLDVASNL